MSIVFLAVLAAAIFLVRLVLRQATRVEWGLATFFVLHFLLIQLQMFADGNGSIVDFRYHAPTYPLLFGWVAAGLVALIRRVPWQYARLTVALTIMVFGVRMFAKLIDNSMREVNEEIARWAADEVARDWRGPRKDSHRVHTNQYCPNKRPSMAGISGLAAYYVGGRQAVHSLTPDPAKVKLFEKPDYIVATRDFIDAKAMDGVMSLCNTREYKCIATKAAARDEYRLYRRQRRKGSRFTP